MNKLEAYFTELFHMEEGELTSGWGDVAPSILGIIATCRSGNYTDGG